LTLTLRVGLRVKGSYQAIARSWRGRSRYLLLYIPPTTHLRVGLGLELEELGLGLRVRVESEDEG
jgi:hypothetical protein